MNEPVTASLEFFTSFGVRLTEGLNDRVEGGATASEPETGTMSHAALAESVTEGALLLHAYWGNEGHEVTGAVLWTGPLSVLLGEDPKAVAELSDEDTAALGDSLHLNLEEGGEGPAPIGWTAIERVAGEELPAKLAAMEIEDGVDGARITVALGEMNMSFVFLVGPPRLHDETPTDQEAADPAVDADQEVAAPGSPGAEIGGAIPEHLLDVRLPLSIRLGSARMNLDEVLRLSPGAIVELDQREDEPLEVLANGRVVARGEVVVVDERFGLKITEIGSSSERLGAL